jgi:Cu-processing system ATP-binding protein
VIEVTNLEKHYDNVAALRGISLEISPGTSVLVSGSNGAGKSTLLRILAGLTRPTRGRVAIHGNDPFGKHAVSYRGRVGFVGQELALYGDLTIEENLRFCARIHGLDSRPGSEPFDPLIELGLTGVARRRVRTLSQGYRRRTSIAMALLARPEVLLLDEPWNGLDSAATRSLSELITAERDRGHTVLAAAHAVPDHADLFDRVIELDGGRLAQGGLQSADGSG